jgi:colanic acid biosynthesis glycosyl transferase WcaI
MSSPRPFQLTVVYEFAGQPDHMMHSVLENLRPVFPEIQVTYLCGLFGTYKPGGLRPARIANLLWVYLRVAWHLTISRPTALLVHSAPPGVQLWAAAWAAIRRIPVFCWLMDYHPEIEARWIERRGYGAAARLIRAVDARLMSRFALIITLDPAMAALARARASAAEVLEHPTWGTNGSKGTGPVSYVPGSSGGPLRLAYSGNLGVAHDLVQLRRLLGIIALRRPVSLLVIGASAEGEARFRELGAIPGVSVEVNPRIPFGELGSLYERHRIDAGIVLLAHELAGVVSPSKFSGYIDFGIPVIYLGPPETNSAKVCRQFNGGFWLQTGAGPADTEQVASSLLDEARMRAAAAGAREAAAYFSGFDGRSLARELAPRMRQRAR